MRKLLMLALMLAATSALAQELRGIKTFYLEGYNDNPNDKAVFDCLSQKASGFQFNTESRTGADAILAVATNVPKKSTSVFWGISPTVRATVKSFDGNIIWSGTNSFKKGTTLWGMKMDIPCGLADGLAKKMAKAAGQ